MTTFDAREKAFENKFFREEEKQFRAVSKRRKFLGMWAAEKMRYSDEESLKYALDIIAFGIEDNTEGAVVKKIMADMKKAGLSVSEAEVREKMQELGEKAIRQIEAES
jgi:hypothetical protein